MLPEFKTVLFADDSPDERLLFARAAQKAGVRFKLQTVPSGEAAVAYLDGAGEYSDRARFPLPELLVLDVNMPGLDGFETLKWVRAQEALRSLPVVMFSTSSRWEDIQKAYELSANSYVIKSANPGELLQIVKMFETYWLDLNRGGSAVREAVARREPVV